jgi:hypothetical protein
MADQLPPSGYGGVCTRCRQPLYFDRDRRALHCKKCDLWYRWLDEEQWEPFRKSPTPTS